METLELGTGQAGASLHGAVLDLLFALVMEESEHDLATGCVVHPTGRIKWLGATFNARRVVWQREHGPLGESVMIGTTCATEGYCLLGVHIVARTRSEHGRWLGTDGWKASRENTTP